FFAQPAGAGFCALMLLMQSALYGTFTAQNFVLWFLFYEMSLIPAFLLIKIWGGENRDHAATKFFVYTFLGSVAMLLSFLGIYFAKGTFDFAALADLGKHGLLSGNVAWLAFAGIFLGLAVKVPLFPFHTWLPDAYETTPTGVSMVLSGVFLQVFNHGITAAALFYYVGLLEQRRGLRGINDFGGLMQRTPLLCGWMSVAMFSSLGLPGLNGFIGEFLIFKGSFALAAS